MTALKAYESVCDRIRAGAMLLLLVGMSMSVYARHYIRLNADFSYARDFAHGSAPQIETLSDAQAWIGGGQQEALSGSNGLAPAIGVGYRYVHNAFMLDLGLGMEYRYRFNRPYEVKNVMAPAVDDLGVAYIGHHAWTGRQTRWQHVGVNIPVMAGGQWNQIYVLAGVKANIDLWGNSYEKGAYTLTGDYDQMMDPINGVAGHGFVKDEPYRMPNQTTALAWDIRACAEIGYCLNARSGRNSYKHRHEPKYYVGAFAEYAFLGTKETYLPLLAGVRVTALIALPEKPHCNCLGY